jgi:hypothetical protein
MKTSPLLAVVLLAAATPASAASRLPADWDRTVSAVVPEADRARQVAALGRRFDDQWQASGEAVRKAEAERRAVFSNQASSTGERRLALNVFRDDRRKAAVGAVDAMLKVKVLVTKKEWKGLWPEGYFAPAAPPPPLAERLRSALPTVVSDPARLGQAQEVAAKLEKAVRADVSAGRKARGRLEDLFAEWETRRDAFIELVNDLNADQEKHDEAAIEAAGQLQKILTAEEWGALAARIAAAP